MFGYLKKIFSLVLIRFFLSTSTIYAQAVRLYWDPSDHPDISHYCIYRASHSDSTFTLINSVYHPDTTCMDRNIQPNSQYYYRATSVDRYGNESDFTNVVEIYINQTPVKLSTFSAHLQGDDVVLEWTTATENNNYGFEIQRSKEDTLSFIKIGFVKGNNTTITPKHYHFIDQNLRSGNYYYRLKQIDYNGDFEFSIIAQVSNNTPKEFQLYQNSPNPFNSTTEISYSLPQSCHVELRIYNLNSQCVHQIVNKSQESGFYNITWDGTDLNGIKVASGIYFYQIKALNFSKFRRMLFIK
jgi:hypothetical protein